MIEENTVRLLITGDFCPHSRVEELMVKGDLNSIFNDFLPELQSNDLNITNLECPLIADAPMIKKSGPKLKADPRCISGLKHGKFNVVTLANNHIMDYGAKGLGNTINLLNQNNISFLGAGESLDEAEKNFYYKKKNIRVAILNFTENEFSIAGKDKPGANPLNPIRNYYKIKEAKEQAKFVVAVVHGGHEGYPLPSPRMVKTYRFFIDSGADVVISHHTHCYSGYEKYGNGYVFYGLGNFLFDWPGVRGASWNTGFAVRLNLLESGEIKFDIIPYKQGDLKPGVELLNGDQLIEFDNNLRELNRVISNCGELERHWAKFADGKARGFLSNLLPDNKYLKAFLLKSNLPLPISDRKKLRLLNLIRCESHYDILLNALKK